MVKQVWNRAGFEEEDQGAEEGEREGEEEAEVGEQAGRGKRAQFLVKH